MKIIIVDNRSDNHHSDIAHTEVAKYHASESDTYLFSATQLSWRFPILKTAWISWTTWFPVASAYFWNSDTFNSLLKRTYVRASIYIDSQHVFLLSPWHFNILHILHTSLFLKFSRLRVSSMLCKHVSVNNIWKLWKRLCHQNECTYLNGFDNWN
jgi:hypothetical protein